jgi:hypothetical protein
MEELDEEHVQLAREACGDIPARFCNVVAVEIRGEGAQVYLLTNNGPESFEEYQVSFVREDGEWVGGGGFGGFNNGTPDHVHRRAKDIAEGRASGLSIW